MRVRVLRAKLYAYALPGSTARQLFNSSTLLDSSTRRQLDSSTELDAALDRPRHPAAQARQARPRQHLESGSTKPRQLDSSRQPGLKFFFPLGGMAHGYKGMGGRSTRELSAGGPIDVAWPRDGGGADP